MLKFLGKFGSHNAYIANDYIYTILLKKHKAVIEKKIDNQESIAADDNDFKEVLSFSTTISTRAVDLAEFSLFLHRNNQSFDLFIAILNSFSMLQDINTLLEFNKKFLELLVLEKQFSWEKFVTHCEEQSQLTPSINLIYFVVHDLVPFLELQQQPSLQQRLVNLKKSYFTKLAEYLEVASVTLISDTVNAASPLDPNKFELLVRLATTIIVEYKLNPQLLDAKFYLQSCATIALCPSLNPSAINDLTSLLKTFINPWVENPHVRFDGTFFETVMLPLLALYIHQYQFTRNQSFKAKAYPLSNVDDFQQFLNAILPKGSELSVILQQLYLTPLNTQTFSSSQDLNLSPSISNLLLLKSSAVRAYYKIIIDSNVFYKSLTVINRTIDLVINFVKNIEINPSPKHIANLQFIHDTLTATINDTKATPFRTLITDLKDMTALLTKMIDSNDFKQLLGSNSNFGLRSFIAERYGHDFLIIIALLIAVFSGRARAFIQLSNKQFTTTDELVTQLQQLENAVKMDFSKRTIESLRAICHLIHKFLDESASYTLATSFHKFYKAFFNTTILDETMNTVNRLPFIKKQIFERIKEGAKTKSEENQRLIDTNEQLNKSIAESNVQNETSKKQTNELTEKIEELENNNIQLNKSINTLNEKSKELAENNKRLQNTTAQSQKKIQDQREEITSLSTQVAQLTTQLKLTTEQSSQQAIQQQQSQQDTSQKLKAFETIIAKQKSGLEKLLLTSSQFDTSYTELTKKSAELQDVKSEVIDDLKKQLAIEHSSLVLAEKSIADNDAIIHDLQLTLSEFEAKNIAFDVENERLHQKVDTLETQNQQVTAQVIALTKQLKERDQSNNDLRKNNQVYAHSNANLSAQVTQLNNQLAQQVGIEESKKKLEQSVKDAEKLIAELKTTHAQLQERLSEERTRAEDFSQYFNAEKNKREQLEIELKGLKLTPPSKTAEQSIRSLFQQIQGFLVDLSSFRASSRSFPPLTMTEQFEDNQVFINSILSKITILQEIVYGMMKQVQVSPQAYYSQQHTYTPTVFYPSPTTMPRQGTQTSRQPYVENNTVSSTPASSDQTNPQTAAAEQGAFQSQPTS